jgi:glycosyltransferase involved in cell wall biosynthesis
MNVAYLLEETELGGGTRVAVAHADALIARGCDVTMITKGGPLTWRASRARWLHVSSFEEVDARRYDFVVGTFWTTVAKAWELVERRAVHLCQGYEGAFSFYQDAKRYIDDTYRLPIPKLVVSERLVEVVRALHDDVTWIGQIVDDEFFQPHETRNATPRVLLVGPMQADVKGIDVAYEAVRHARAAGARFELIRVSQWAPADGEPVELASEFHVAIDTAAMANLFASCDVYVGPSRAEEGFGLPAAEAMAGGVPAVLSAIPSFLSWDARQDYALFAADGDGAAMGTQLARLLDDRALQVRLAARGREVAEQFRAEKTGARLEAFFASRLPPSS